MRPSVIKVAAWGEKHVRSMCETILPCLAAPGNLPSLVKMSPTYLMIYADRACPPDCVNVLETLDKIPGLKTAVQRITTTGGETARDSRMILAHTERDSLNHAREFDADWFDFQSDTIIDSGFLTAVKKRLQQHNAVFGLPFRSRDTLFHELTEGNRNFNSHELYDIALKAMHPVTLNYFVQQPPSNIPADPHQFFFIKNERFVCRSWQPRPYGLYSRALPDFGMQMPMTIDTFVLAAIDRRKAYVQEEVPGEFFLTALDGESIPTFGSFPMTVESIVNAIKAFSGGYQDAIRAYVWALKHRCVYHVSDDDCMPAVKNSENERATMIKIFRALGH